MLLATWEWDRTNCSSAHSPLSPSAPGSGVSDFHCCIINEAVRGSGTLQEVLGNQRQLLLCTPVLLNQNSLWEVMSSFRAACWFMWTLMSLRSSFTSPLALFLVFLVSEGKHLDLVWVNVNGWMRGLLSGDKLNRFSTSMNLWFSCSCKQEGDEEPKQ